MIEKEVPIIFMIEKEVPITNDTAEIHFMTWKMLIICTYTHTDDCLLAKIKFLF